MATSDTHTRTNGHLRIFVSEGKVTLEELQKALEEAIKVTTHGGCNCGLTGFDVSFVRGDPALTSLGNIANIRGAVMSRD